MEMPKAAIVRASMKKRAMLMMRLQAVQRGWNTACAGDYKQG